MPQNSYLGQNGSPEDENGGPLENKASLTSAGPSRTSHVSWHSHQAFLCTIIDIWIPGGHLRQLSNPSTHLLISCHQVKEIENFQLNKGLLSPCGPN